MTDVEPGELRVDLLVGCTSTQTLERLYGPDWQAVVDRYAVVVFYRDGVHAGTFSRGAPIAQSMGHAGGGE